MSGLNDNTPSQTGGQQPQTEVLDDFFAIMGMEGLILTDDSDESEISDGKKEKPEPTEEILIIPEAPELNERSTEELLNYFAPDCRLFGRRDAPMIDLSKKTGGLSSIFQNALCGVGDIKLLEGLVEQFQFLERMVYDGEEATYNLKMINLTYEQEFGLKLLDAEELDEITIDEMTQTIKTCEAIEGSLIEEHLSELQNPTEEEIQQMIKLRHTVARESKATDWSGFAFQVLLAEERKNGLKRVNWTRSLMYALFEFDLDALLNIMSPGQHMGAKREVKKGPDALTVTVLDCYEPMSCHKDAAKMLALCGKDEGRTGGVTQNDQKEGWKVPMKALLQHLTGNGAFAYWVQFPGHSMFLVRLETSVDFYESVAGGGASNCIMTLMTGPGNAKAKRNITLSDIETGIEDLLICDSLDRNNEKFSRGGHLMRAFGYSDGSLSVPREGDFIFIWNAAPMASPQEITDRIRTELMQSVAIADFLGRAPFYKDSRPFKVILVESRWKILTLDRKSTVDITALSLGEGYIFILSGGGATPREAKGKVVEPIEDEMTGNLKAFSVQPFK